MTKEPAEADVVGPPIPGNAMCKMTDENWLQAMRKYAGIQFTAKPGPFSGGEWELALALQAQTRVDPGRFIALAGRMADSLPVSYFGGILRGIAESIPAHEAESLPVTAEQAVGLIRRVHSLPQRPCGRDITWLIGKWPGSPWPDDVVEAVSWYATEHPDPETEIWRQDAGNGTAHYSGDPYAAGLNSVRGSAALCLAALVFEEPARFELLRATVERLVCDPSIAVRSCVAELLVASLNVDVPVAIAWFKALIAIDDALLGTPHVERFIQYAGYRDYPAIAEIVQRMLKSANSSAVEAAARQVSLLALDVAEAEPDAVPVRTGDEVMRKAAANVYAVNVAHPTVGERCRTLLMPFFADPSKDVRDEAAEAFRHLAELSTDQQELLLSGFLESIPGPEAMETVVRVMEESPVQLPDLVCDLLERAVSLYREEGGDISKRGAAVAFELSKIVVRLYAQTEDPRIKTCCLGLIDDMEKYNFLGLADELVRLDR